MTRQQLLTLGLQGESIAHRVRKGRLHRVHCAVYAVGHPPITPLERAMAAVLACGEGAVLSHGSALALWGIWKRWDLPFDVTVKVDRRPKGIRVHRNKLHRNDLTRQQGIPVTTLARALLDMAPRMRPKSLNRAINNGRLDDHLSLDALFDILQRHPNHPGAKDLKGVLGIATKRPTRSGFERRFLASCKRYGLPRPETNFPFGKHELDVFFPNEGVIVELDSWLFHSSRTSFESDRSKDADTLAAGLVTIRITEERFEAAPEQEISRVHAILAQRRRSAA